MNEHTRIYRFELQDGRERYIRTDTPWDHLDGRRDIEDVRLVERHARTAYVEAAIALDNLDGLAWAYEMQRRLAIDEITRGATVEHAVAVAARQRCSAECCESTAMLAKFAEAS